MNYDRGPLPVRRDSDAPLDLYYWTLKNKALTAVLEQAAKDKEKQEVENRLRRPIAVRVTDYGDGYTEASWGIISSPGKKAPRGQSENRDANIERAARRAKGNLRRKCMAMEADRILTLTFKENVTDWDLAWSCFKSFTRRVNRKLVGFSYVAVPERQKRGSWHFHLAIKGWQDAKMLRALWRKSTPDKQGNIDITRPRTGGAWKRENLVRYLTKYLTKAHKETALFNKKKFSSSRRILVPTFFYTLHNLTVDEAIDVIADEVGILGGAVTGAWWGLNDTGLQGWLSSW